VTAYGLENVSGSTVDSVMATEGYRNAQNHDPELSTAAFSRDHPDQTNRTNQQYHITRTPNQLC